MDSPGIEPISAQSEARQTALLELNNANARETSALTAAEGAKIVGAAFSATCIPEASALLIALDQTADVEYSFYGLATLALCQTCR